MAVTVTKAGGNTTFKFEIVATSAKLDPILDKWAKRAWYAGFGVYEGSPLVLKDFALATNAEKFATLNKRLKYLSLQDANTQEDVDAKVSLVVTSHDLDGVS